MLGEGGRVAMLILCVLTALLVSEVNIEGLVVEELSGMSVL